MTESCFAIETHQGIGYAYFLLTWDAFHLFSHHLLKETNMAKLTIVAHITAKADKIDFVKTKLNFFVQKLVCGAKIIDKIMSYIFVACLCPY